MICPPPSACANLPRLNSVAKDSEKAIEIAKCAKYEEQC